MRDVFVSYATEDKEAAEAACRALEATGLRCWIAPRDIHPGSVWGEAIVDGISNCDSLVLMLSDAANRSHHIPRELECAVDRNLAIIPFRLEPVVPSKSISYFIASAQWLEGHPPPLEQHLDSLIAAVRYQLSHPPSRTATDAWQVPADGAAREIARPRSRRGRRLLLLAVAACALVAGLGRALHWSALGFGREATGSAAGPAACGSAYGARRWSDALARCVDVAAAGNLAAQRLVGAIYRRGLGVAENPDRAAAWLARAARQGDDEARATLRETYGDRAAAMPATLPYSAHEVIELVASGARPEVVLRLIGESCVRFSLDSATADRLLAARATGALVMGIRSACRTPAAGQAPPISVARLDTLVRRRAQAQADSARLTGFPSFGGITPFLALGRAWWRALAEWADSSAAAARAPSPTVTPRARPRTAAAPAPPVVAPVPAAETAARPAGEPAPEQKISGSLLDAAKQGAREAAEEAAKKKAADAVRKVF